MNDNTSQQLPAQALPATPSQSAIKPVIAAPQPIAPPSPQTIVLHASQDPVPINIKTSPTDYNGIALSVLASMVVAVVTSTIGFRVAKHQQRANTKAQLRLDAYNAIQGALTKYSEVEWPLSRIPRIRAALEGAVQGARQGQQLPLLARFEEFENPLEAYISSLSNILSCLDRYEAILPGFSIIKTALLSARWDIRRYRGPFEMVLLNWLPVSGFDHSGRPSLINAKAITQEAVDQFNEAAKTLELALHQASAWVFDLGVEAQNFSLKEYAEQAVPRRQPDSGGVFTVTIDPADREELQKKFDAMAYGQAVIGSKMYAHGRYMSGKDWQKANEG